MGLASGTRIGPYELLSPLGAGGMGEVYRARDTKLNRDVALKVLPEALLHDSERMVRFKREAQVLAALNHPNIATIFGFEESDSGRALAMELVEGQTLAEIVGARHGVPLHDVLPIAKQIAEALEYAHERGIIHRDLKPANVKVTPAGVVKVLDFGLAKALDLQTSSSDLSNSPTMSPTLSIAATQAGVIIGTAAYMSPEQARGKSVDRRADIWAFGCVLFEMLSGRKPFEGETVTDVLASIVKTEPDWNALPENTALRIRELIRRCLTKDPKQRLRDIGEARIAIEDAISGSPSPPAPLPQGEGGPQGRVRVSARQRALPWAVAAVALILGLAAGWWYGNRNATAPVEWSGELLPGPTVAFWPRVSPDGRLVAFQALIDNMSQVAVIDPESGNWSVLTKDRAHGLVASLSWAPDGSKIYFDRFTSQPQAIYSVPTLGGEAREILNNAAVPEPLPDGSLLVVRVDPDRQSQIYHFWPDTGKLQAMGGWVSLNPAAPLRVFPDGKEAVFFGTSKDQGSDKSSHLYLLDISTGACKRLAPELPITLTAQTFPLAVTPDGKSVLIDLPSGNLHRIVAVPRSGESSARTLMSLTSAIWCLDEARDGSLYVDQVGRPMQFLRYQVAGGTPQVLESNESYPVSVQVEPPAEFPDGRMILPALIAGRARLLVGKPGGSFVPLLQTNEETGPPMIRVGDAQVALMLGSGAKQAVTLASVKEGRILRRFDDTEGKDVSSLAASPDGKTLYYVGSGTVWSIPVEGGNPKKLCAGDGVAVDPNGKDLIVNLIEQQVVRLERVPISGGSPKEIQVKTDAPITPVPIGPATINRAGKMLIGVVPTDSWFFRLGVLDLTTGVVTRVPLNYEGDIMVSAWASDGNIESSAMPIRAHLWRFKPMTRGQQ